MVEGSFWYLGSVYSRYPRGHQAAFIGACIHTADLLNVGLRVYSPIVAIHPLVVHGGLKLTTFDECLSIIRPFMDAAVGIIVVRMEGWETSEGIAAEREIFKAARKPILDVPPVILAEDPERVARICRVLAP